MNVSGSSKETHNNYVYSTCYFLWTIWILFCVRRYHRYRSLVMRKPVFRVCDQVRHKPACAATEARYRLESSDIETRGIILSRQRTTMALISLRECAGWSAPLLFAYCINMFSYDVAHAITELKIDSEKILRFRAGPVKIHDFQQEIRTYSKLG